MQFLSRGDEYIWQRHLGGLVVRPSKNEMADQKKVCQLPLDCLGSAEGVVGASRVRFVGVSEIKELLRLRDVEFVVANIGSTLEWIPKAETFRFWKSEVIQHLAEPENGIALEQFPGEYVYLASSWRTPDDRSIILLETFH